MTMPSSLKREWICLMSWLLSWNEPPRSVAWMKTQKSMLESPKVLKPARGSVSGYRILRIDDDHVGDFH